MTDDVMQRVRSDLSDGRDVMIICESQFQARKMAREMFAAVGSTLCDGTPPSVEVQGAVAQFTWPRLHEDRRPSEFDRVIFTFGDSDADRED